jgi:hypothetical protein
MKMSDLHIEQMERDESPSAIQIERDVPMPDQLKGRPQSPARAELEKVLDHLNVGDSFLLPESLIERGAGHPQVKANVRVAFKKRDMKCIARATDLGLRIWRTH